MTGHLDPEATGGGREVGGVATGAVRADKRQRCPNRTPVESFGSTEWRTLLRFKDDAPLVEFQDVSKSYPAPGGRVDALRSVSVALQQAEFCAIVGPSGSGKSTLLHLMAGLIHPTSGKVLFKGLDMNAGELAIRKLILQEYIGLVPQEINLIRYLTARENVELPMEMMGVRSAERKERALGLLREVGLLERVDHLPFELSMGEQQRVALARALVLNPALVLADEPTANLDSCMARKIVALMAKERETRGATFVFATHDPEVTELCDRVMTIRDGVLQNTSAPIAPDVELEPLSFFTAALFGHLRLRIAEELCGRTFEQSEQVKIFDASFRVTASGLESRRFTVAEHARMVYRGG